MWSHRSAALGGHAPRAATPPRRARLGRVHPRRRWTFGDPTCPLIRCRNVSSPHVDKPGRCGGHAKASSDLGEMTHEYAEFRVHVRGVCQGCGWNHLAVSFLLANRRPPARDGLPG
ncbi:DUF5318 family protein [Acrocarpospora catenulata]|uniref:DUF5318 family protein n=1 Tax=Acrocarpospora catenulata TaxID=2836182 RepID=UPI001BDADA4F|nr:DUF5318 family protein [Acrocarpospora catenulata]